jgi:cyclic pyranopterin phosphate synthase
VAIIPAFTRNICRTCNRIRITADGKIRNCLFSHDEFDLLKLLQNGESDAEVKIRLKDAMWQKDIDGWQAGNKGKGTRSSMALIGG